MITAGGAFGYFALLGVSMVFVPAGLWLVVHQIPSATRKALPGRKDASAAVTS